VKQGTQKVNVQISILSYKIWILCIEYTVRHWIRSREQRANPLLKELRSQKIVSLRHGGRKIHLN